MTLRILITGSRTFAAKDVVAKALAGQGELVIYDDQCHWGDVTVVHGGAKGADMLAHQVARAWGMRTEVHPADWAKHGKAAGPKRNAELVRLGADVALAFLDDSPCRGTRGCADLADRADIPVVAFFDSDAARQRHADLIDRYGAGVLA